MYEYLKFLLVKLKSIDDKLTVIALLQNKFWVRINDKNLNEKWFFKENGELLISINGNIVDGRYEQLSEGSLIVELDKNKILLNQNFIYNDILLLKKDSDDSDFYAFYDDSKFNNSEFEQFIEVSRKEVLNTKILKLADNTEAEVLMKPNKNIISLGDSVLINQKLTVLEFLETANNFYELKEGEITGIFIKDKYKIAEINIVVKQHSKILSVGDTIVHSNEFIHDGRYKIGSNLGIEIIAKEICSKYSIITCETLNKKHCLEVWCMDSMGFSNGDLVFENGEFVQDGKYRLSILKTLRVVAGEIV
ncbi:hypothetical protein I2486_07085 [Cellulophaga sp. E16_2]|uniref:hypothetical protein n=1 Tax=Cellulophaga sp. E16_2 TaxID=2789297 RepID=UPI001A91AA11|nr:hypothetical protein [Cellulophaga sp. E16_2]MBO0591170.1 hypothetical protein [Cellulophaga sp. E16_2]